MAGWATFAAVAVAAGIGAVALAQGGSLAGPEQPLSEDEVLEQLADVDQAASTADEPSASGEPSPGGTADSGTAGTGAPGAEATPTTEGGHVLGGDGGTFMAVCEGDRVRIDWWTPAQGWNAAAVDQGPGAQASVTFTAAGDDDDDDGLVYTATCTGGVPAAALASGDDADD
ncbi:hypothetical protein GCM10009830_11900 [Glycomyces endophyticus]|uniref:Septum formation initiator n=1 Tax=Glycomyces endophyticus TaxID=480996 RepID=A0ABN2G9W9_9ACTN